MQLFERIKTALFDERERTLRQELDARKKDIEKSAIKEYKKTHTVTDMVRENLRMWNPRKLARDRVHAYDMHSKSHILEQFDTEEAQNVFLSQAHQLFKDTTLRSIVEYLVAEQIMYVAMDARTLDDVLLGQHNMNGILLVTETLQELEALYEERKSNVELDEED